MSNNYYTKYSSPHNPLPTILACSLLNCPKLNQAFAMFPFLSLFLWLSRISFLILTLLKSKLLTNLIKLIHGINSFNPPNISLRMVHRKSYYHRIRFNITNFFAVNKSSLQGWNEIYEWNFVSLFVTLKHEQKLSFLVAIFQLLKSKSDK